MPNPPAHRPRILQITSTARTGGTERNLLRLLSRCDRARFDWTVAAMEPEGPMLDEVRAMGFEAVGLSSPNPWNPSTRGETSALMRTGGFALVHVYGLRAELLARGAARRAGVPAVVSGIRNTDPWRRAWHVWLDRWTARGGRVDLFISNSEAGRRSRIEREKFPPGKIRVVPNGVDPPTDRDLAEMDARRPEVRRRWGVAPQDGPVLVDVANLRASKGHLDLVAAAARLAPRFPRLRVLLVGRDDSDGRVEAAAREAGVAEHFVFCGLVEDPFPLVRAADVYCMPSHWEGMPTALLEAMGLARPVVASTAGGIPELARDGQEALLVPPKAPEALAAALERVLTDDALAARLGAAARERACGEFSLDRMVEHIESIYAELIAAKTR